MNKNMNSIESTKLYNFVLKRLEKENIDFIGFIVSPFHALGIDSYLYGLSKKNKNLKGLIFINPHSKSGFIVNKKDLRCSEFADVEIIYIKRENYLRNKNNLKKISNGINMYLGLLNIMLRKKYSKRELFILTIMNINIFMLSIFSNKKLLRDYYPRFVLIDEGIGTYMSKQVWKLEGTYINSSLDDKSIFSRLKRLFVIFLLKMASYYKNIEKRFIFYSRKDNIYVNEHVIASYRKIIEINKNHIKNNDIINLTKYISGGKFVILATQPFVEYNQIKLFDYMDILDNLLKILNKRNLKIVLKPHPREDEKKYEIILKNYKDIYICTKNFLLEEILYLNPIKIFGFTTTSLITSKLFYGIESISLANIIIKNTNDSLINNRGSEFKSKFKKYVHFVNDFKEIEDLIKV